MPTDRFVIPDRRSAYVAQLAVRSDVGFDDHVAIHGKQQFADYRPLKRNDHWRGNLETQPAGPARFGDRADRWFIHRGRPPCTIRFTPDGGSEERNAVLEEEARDTASNDVA
jgi:hypothetical protein